MYLLIVVCFFDATKPASICNHKKFRNHERMIHFQNQSLFTTFYVKNHFKTVVDKANVIKTQTYWISCCLPPSQQEQMMLKRTILHFCQLTQDCRKCPCMHSGARSRLIRRVYQINTSICRCQVVGDFHSTTLIVVLHFVT